jgi:hypothetical protein
MTGPLLELSFCANSPVPVLNISLSLFLKSKKIPGLSILKRGIGL